jgi:hypothetical protein
MYYAIPTSLIEENTIKKTIYDLFDKYEVEDEDKRKKSLKRNIFTPLHI